MKIAVSAGELASALALAASLSTTGRIAPRGRAPHCGRRTLTITANVQDFVHRPDRAGGGRRQPARWRVGLALAALAAGFEAEARSRSAAARRRKIAAGVATSGCHCRDGGSAGDARARPGDRRRRTAREERSRCWSGRRLPPRRKRRAST